MRAISFASLAALALAACSDGTGPASRSQFKLSFGGAGQSGAVPMVAASMSAPITATGGGNTIVITRAQIVLEEIELKNAVSHACDDDSSGPDGDDCEEVRVDPMLVDIPLDGSVSPSIVVSVPPGTYRELELEIEAVDDGEHGAAAFLAAHPEFEGVSVRVEGTFNGQPFVYTSALEAELELEFDPPVATDANGLNVTLNMNVGNWFRSPSGGVIDPATANLGGPNTGLVRSNIQASFEAFEDDDHDGRADGSSDDS